MGSESFSGYPNLVVVAPGMKQWLEVSLTVDHELAEAVADVLARFAPNGVMMEQGVAFRDDEDAGEPAGPVEVRAYLPADAGLQEKRKAIEKALYFLGMVRKLPEPTFREIEDRNWMEEWKSRYRPIEIGKRLVIAPAWMTVERAGRVAVRIEPGMAFGTGTHPSTQLCLELLERAFEWTVLPPGQPDVIDVGCGSGILSIAAVKFGATHALAVDIDVASLRNARENAELNGVVGRLTLGHGSVAEVLAGTFGPTSASIVMANILAPVIIRLLQEGLGKLVRSGGLLVVGGILREQELGVLTAAEQIGMSLVERRSTGDWVSLLLTR